MTKNNFDRAPALRVGAVSRLLNFSKFGNDCFRNNRPKFLLSSFEDHGLEILPSASSDRRIHSPLMASLL